mmetsp:Transcript_18410/g.56500  ORF Transcript_18410/g.56500 Transcript_18410/m.56500 type:complete len:205 (+) Transcript_18410:213-827(+)
MARSRRRSRVSERGRISLTRAPRKPQRECPALPESRRRARGPRRARRSLASCARRRTRATRLAVAGAGLPSRARPPRPSARASPRGRASCVLFSSACSSQRRRRLGRSRRCSFWPGRPRVSTGRGAWSSGSSRPAGTPRSRLRRSRRRPLRRRCLGAASWTAASSACRRRSGRVRRARSDPSRLRRSQRRSPRGAAGSVRRSRP